MSNGLEQAISSGLYTPYSDLILKHKTNLDEAKKFAASYS